jgi:uncharacterized membrane protein
MVARTSLKFPCDICKRSFSKGELTEGDSIRAQIFNLIKSDHPEWSTENRICRNDLALYRMKHVQKILSSEKGELTSLEEEVLRSLKEHELIADNVDKEFEQEWTFGERLADKIATLGGSWSFLIAFGGFLVVWIVINSVVLLSKPVDPYPFILLNLILSCLAAIQAPVIMMSQNRQEAKDRLRSQHDYQVNLKAELEIRHLHEKVDHLLSHQWDRLVEIQEIQLELLEELSNRKGRLS